LVYTPFVAGEEISIEEARRLIAGDYGREMQNQARRYAVPIFWVEAKGKNGEPDVIRNGTTFFVDTGSAVFGVTAGHVYDGFVGAAAGGLAARSVWAVAAASTSASA
jgi:hypothetical protein